MRKAQYRLYWGFHISQRRVFNYFKIRARERPVNAKEKSALVFTVLACQKEGNGEKKR
jgi:hypothetical protein